MIPQSIKDIIANGDSSGLYQTLATLIFIFIFFGMVWYVVSRPKRHYEEEQNAPLEEDNVNSLNNN